MRYDEAKAGGDRGTSETGSNGTRPPGGIHPPDTRATQSRSVQLASKSFAWGNGGSFEHGKCPASHTGKGFSTKTYLSHDPGTGFGKWECQSGGRTHVEWGTREMLRCRVQLRQRRRRPLDRRGVPWRARGRRGQRPRIFAGGPSADSGATNGPRLSISWMRKGFCHANGTIGSPQQNSPGGSEGRPIPRGGGHSVRCLPTNQDLLWEWVFGAAQSG